MPIGRTELAAGIRKHGFRKWYERELISSHVHLVLTFLAMIGLLGSFEVYDRRAPLADQFTRVRHQAPFLVVFSREQPSRSTT